MDAVVCFDVKARSTLNVMKRLVITPGNNMRCALAVIYLQRVADAGKKFLKVLLDTKDDCVMKPHFNLIHYFSSIRATNFFIQLLNKH